MVSDCPTGPREILAPELSISQDIETPYIASFGILMPIPDSMENIQLWVKYLTDFLKNKEALRISLLEKSRERISDFALEIIHGHWLSLTK